MLDQFSEQIDLLQEAKGLKADRDFITQENQYQSMPYPYFDQINKYQ